MNYAARSEAWAVMALGLLALLGADRAVAECKLSKIVELPVTLAGMHPTVTAQINGKDASFIVDSGAFYSMLSPASAAEYGLKTYPAPYGLTVRGIGGAADISVTKIKSFTLVGVPIHDLEFLVGGGDVSGVGVLGQNLLRISDVEYDLAKGVIRMIRAEGCKKTNFAYWAAKANLPYSVINIQSTTPLESQTSGWVFVNGVKIHAVFDTGSGLSVLTRHAAERAGVKMDADGVTDGGFWRGIGRSMVKSWIVPVASFKIGDEEVRNTKLRVADMAMDSTEMLIGADFFLSHRIYVASSEHQLFFTYNGGPVFNLTATRVPAATSAPEPASAPGASAPETAAAAAEGTARKAGPADEPTDAAGYSRRGTAFAARRDYTHAIADLDRACGLAPDEADYVYERGLAYLHSGDTDQALANFDQALKLKADDVPALVSRAEIRLGKGQTGPAVEDLDAADRAATRQADARLWMAMGYLHAAREPQAVVQFGLWLDAHRGDARVGLALANRCWARALTGQELAMALKDCSAALDTAGKSEIAERVAILNSRGLVRERLGDYDKSIADYTAALALEPTLAWARYGRGIDELRRGKIADGKADIAAATAATPEVSAEFARRGILP